MQTTLLGLAIAFILALVAALVGPYIIDLNQFRPQFEAEAARVLGAPVHVDGKLEARLLPTPSLRLRSVAIGRASPETGANVDQLNVDFSLGSLMRGEWRATELALNGLKLDLSLDEDGRIAGPLSGDGFNFSSLTIDRLNLSGQLALHDAAKRTAMRLDDVVFSGDVRMLSGAARGDGYFNYDGVRYPFHLASNRNDDTATRVHLSIDSADRPVALDLEGALAFEERSPHFDGTMVLTRAIALRVGEEGRPVLQTPWKLTAKIKATSASAQFEQLEALYGSDDIGLKLTGGASLAFGASPSLRVNLAARQLEADRLLEKEASTTEPAQLLRGARNLIAAIPAPPFATRIELAAEQVTLGGRPIQNIKANLHSDFNSNGAVWIVDQLAGRAPGASQINLNGQLVALEAGNHFTGGMQVQSSDLETLMMWWRGRSSSGVTLQSQTGLRADGSLNISGGHLTLENINAKIGDAAIQGHVSLSDRDDRAASKGQEKSGQKLDAELNAERLDLDGLINLGRGLIESQEDWPDEIRLLLDVGHGAIGGRDIGPLKAQVNYDPASITLTSLKIGSPDDIKLEGSGVFDRKAVTGKSALVVEATSLANASAFFAPVLPSAVMRRLDAFAKPKDTAQGSAKLKLSLALDKANTSGHVNGAVTLDLDAPQVKGFVRVSAEPEISALQHFDFGGIERNNLSVESKISTDQAAALVTALGIDHIIAVDKGAAQFEGRATAISESKFQLSAKLAGDNLDAELKGSAEVSDGPWLDRSKAEIVLSAPKIDISPLLDLNPGLVISLASRVNVDGMQLTFEDLDSKVGPSQVRGHLVLTRGEVPTIDGELTADSLDWSSIFRSAIGRGGQGAPRTGSQSLRSSVLQNMHGQVAFQASSSVLFGMEFSPVNGTVKSDGRSLTFDSIKARIGDGDAKADIVARTDDKGLTIDARVQLDGVNGSALHYGDLRAPEGRTSLQMMLATRGRSSDALVGALSGSGTMSVDRARIAGLDPNVFDVALGASDAGQVSNDQQLRDLVSSSLSSAPLSVSVLQIPFSIRDGNVRVASSALEGEGAKAIVTGGYDITADQVDIRASFLSTRFGTETSRPEIQIFAHGPTDRLHRTIDVSSLSSWLAVRAIDRETRRLDSLERGEGSIPSASVDPSVRSPTPRTNTLPEAPPQVSNLPEWAVVVPPLPPPITVRPPPGAGKKRERGAPLILTPSVQN